MQQSEKCNKQTHLDIFFRAFCTGRKQSNSDYNGFGLLAFGHSLYLFEMLLAL